MVASLADQLAAKLVELKESHPVDVSAVLMVIYSVDYLVVNLASLMVGAKD